MKNVVLHDSPGEIIISIKSVYDQEQLAYDYLDTIKNNIIGDDGRQLEKKARLLFNEWKVSRECAEPSCPLNTVGTIAALGKYSRSRPCGNTA